MKVLVLMVVSLAISSCSIQQEVSQLPDFEESDICIIKNPKVKTGFITEYRAALEKGGYTVKYLDSKSNLMQCPITSTYTANWKWDVAWHMQYAKITVFRNGNSMGSAVYDATWGGARLDKFISAEDKIVELVNQLFPTTNLKKRES